MEIFTFSIMVVGLGFLFAALRLGSGSIWPAVVAHATFNAGAQKFFGLFWKAASPGADRMIDVLTGLTAAAAGTWIWMRSRKRAAAR
jgi:hypothetical protein